MEKVERRRRFPIDPKKAGLIVAAVILFFLVMDLNGRLNELSRLSAQRDKAETVVSVLQSTLSSLETQVAYSKSEGAVEEWAYQEGHMARPGEQLIIPLQSVGITVEPMLLPTATVEPIQNWEVWMALVLGK